MISVSQITLDNSVGTDQKPKKGLLARVRQRNYLIEDVVAPPNGGDSAIVTLSCVDQDAQGKRLQVLWDLEPEAYVKGAERWEGLGTRPFDKPEYFAAYLNTVRWNCVTATDPTLFQAPFRAGIEIETYQMEPLRKALLLPRVNLFIADDVGLGKTIEAGLIARELLLRKKVRTIIVSCPPSMLEQWQEELESRFGLRFEILDRDYVAKVRLERGFGINPWQTHPRLLVSHRLLIDESYASGLRSFLGPFLAGSLFILDEAHHAAPASGRKYAIDTKITKAVRDLAKRFEHRLFLSATPHNGHSNSFSMLLSLLDNQRFTPGAPISPKMTEPILVRRLKDDLRRIGRAFPERKVEQIDIENLPAGAPELRLSELLDQYHSVRQTHLAGEPTRVQALSSLLITNLQQRLLSSVAAFARTLAVHRRAMEKSWAKEFDTRTTSPKRQDLNLSAPDADDERAELDQPQLEAAEQNQIEAITAAVVGKHDETASFQVRERALLDEMQSLADANRNVADARINRLRDWIFQHCLEADSKTWSCRRVLIFTEWEDTLVYLKTQITYIVRNTDCASERLAIFRGSTGRSDRDALRDAFNAPPDQHPLRILIATDAAREGLNLQAHCNHLFHFDIPWNPARLEQRNGRIDRKLQPATEVFCYYFVYKQRPEDRVLKAIVGKMNRIREELGSATQVIEPKLEALLRGGIRRDRADELSSAVDALDIDGDKKQAMLDEFESSRIRELDLRRELERLEKLRHDSERDIQFDQNHFIATLNCALELNHCDRLEALGSPAPGKPERFRIPALAEQAGAGWEAATDSLRQKREPGQNIWDWRRSAPIRPVVFRDPGEVTNEVVQFHLEHPVVQRLLQRFLSQGFIHDDLSRTCIAHSQDAIKRIAILGRLALYGSEAARLHEEIVIITARWTDSEIRTEALKPYERETELRTINLLYDSLLQTPYKALPEIAADQLRRSQIRDVAELWPYLQKRADEADAYARKMLQKRAQEEATAMRSILETQKKEIEKQQIKMAQMSFEGMGEEDRRQREAERKFQDDRLRDLPGELKSEPARIHDLYEVRASRLEPIGLVYLWPVGA